MGWALEAAIRGDDSKGGSSLWVSRSRIESGEPFGLRSHVLEVSLTFQALGGSSPPARGIRSWETDDEPRLCLVV